MSNPILDLHDNDGVICWYEVSLLEFLHAAMALSYSQPHMISVEQVNKYDMESVKGMIQDARDHLENGGE